MAATIHPHRPHLQLASATAVFPQSAPDHPMRPALRPIEGGRSRASLRRRRVYWRRRLVVALGLVSVLVVAWQAAVGVTALFADPAPDVVPAPAVAAPPFTGSTYVVQPGDTLWSIAGRVAPDRDPRPVVDELSHWLGGAPVRPGQPIDLRGLVP